MASISLDEISITKFIFHIVHDGQNSATLMDDTPIGTFSTFFKERIQEVYDGNRFEFIENSLFLDKMVQIKEKPSSFIEVSKELAREFHTHQDKRVKPGVMILMELKISKEKAFALIKYDNENVITYSKKGTMAILSEISNTFSKSKNALQKSAIIHMTETPFAAVIDHSEREHITQFFKGFLGVERTYSDADLTEKLRKCYINTVRANKDVLPATYTKTVTERFYEIVQKQKKFQRETFAKTIFGEHYSEDIEKSFRKELYRNDIQGEEFNLNKKIPKPRQKKLRTNEGVLIQYNQEAEDTVVISESAKETIITIKTVKLIVEQ